mgnify:CR=1 FL=1
MKSASINVRVEAELLDLIRRYGLNISDIVRTAMLSEVEKARRQKIKENLEAASQAVKKMGMAQIVRDIREMRESR